MTTQGTRRTRTVTAGATITNDMLFKAATIGGTIAAGPLQAAGLIESTASAGQGLTVAVDGDCKLKIGAAVGTVGYPLTITTSGWFIAATVSGGMHVGRSMQLGNSGDTIQAYIDFQQMAAAAFA